MGLIEQGISIADNGTGSAIRRPTKPPIPAGTTTNRVNWLFSGVLLGAAGWLLVLGVIFAVTGAWIVAGALLGGVCGCLLPVWRAGRRLR